MPTLWRLIMSKNFKTPMEALSRMAFNQVIYKNVMPKPILTLGKHIYTCVTKDCPQSMEENIIRHKYVAGTNSLCGYCGQLMMHKFEKEYYNE